MEGPALQQPLLEDSAIMVEFMNARRGGPTTHLMIVVGLFWLGILIVGTMKDYLTRAWLGIPGH
jgi:hypothetical protein